MAYTQILKAGLQASYDALATKETNVLYFCTDSQKIYKGEIDFTSNVIVAASKPATPITGKIYVLADTNTVEVYVNGSWKVVSYPVATAIDMNSDDVHVASAKAVYDAIQDAVESLASSENSVKGIAAGTADATIVVTKGDDTTADVVVPGVVTTPTWDATARKLTLPVAGGTSVEVNIGKDIFVDPEAENKYNPETGNIEIYLNDGSEGSQSTKIEIPASALVDVYEGGDTNSAKVTVGEDNVIKVNVVVDPAEGNALVLTETGLKVDLSAYAKTADLEAVSGSVSGLTDRVTAVEGTANANKGALEILNGDSNTDGSVAKQIATASAALTAVDEALTARVETLETNTTQLRTDLDALATAATGWGEF